jgi:hypothetical protein
MSGPEQLGFDDVAEAPVWVWCAWCGAENQVLVSELTDEQRYLDDDEYCCAHCVEAAMPLAREYLAYRQRKKARS